MAKSYEGLSDLQPKALTGIAIKKTQGKFFGSELLPERAHPEWAGYYKKYNEVAFGKKAPKMAEGADVELLGSSYTEHSFSMEEYRIGEKLTERALNYLMAKDSRTHRSAGRDLLNDAIEFCTETIRLRQENRTVDEIVDNASSNNQVAASNKWSDSSNGTPLTDIREAIANIRNNWHVEPNTLILTPNNEKNLLLSDQVKEWFTYTSGSKVAQSAGMSTAMPAGIAGLDVFVVDAVTMSGIESGGTESNILGDSKAIVMKRGASTGVTYVGKDINSNSWTEGKNRSVFIDVQKIFVPVIFTPKTIGLIKTIA